MIWLLGFAVDDDGDDLPPVVGLFCFLPIIWLPVLAILLLRRAIPNDAPPLETESSQPRLGIGCLIWAILAAAFMLGLMILSRRKP